MSTINQLDVNKIDALVEENKEPNLLAVQLF